MLALISPMSSRSAGIVRLRTKATEFVCLLCINTRNEIKDVGYAGYIHTSGLNMYIGSHLVEWGSQAFNFKYMCSRYLEHPREDSDKDVITTESKDIPSERDRV
jgi:hypothetical protein